MTDQNLRFVIRMVVWVLEFTAYLGTVYMNLLLSPRLGITKFR